jgi:membrane fusion protein, multidrug efflux system
MRVREVVVRRRSVLIAALIVLTASVVAIVLWRVHAHRVEAAKAAAGPPPIPVVTAEAAKQDVPIYLTGIGTVLAAQTVTVKVRVDGQLEKLSFTEGQDVKEGDLLAQIDPRPYQAALEQAVAQKAKDEASLAAAEKDLQRYTTLAAQDSISQQVLDTTRATVGQLKASVQADQAQIDNARTQLGYTTIRSPLTGRTGVLMVDPGNIVHATDTTGIVVINQVDPIHVVFTLPEDAFQQVMHAMQANGRTPLEAVALARETGAPLATGRLKVVNNQIDTQTGTFQLKALFPNGAHTLWPGQYVNVRLTVGTRRDATTVPESAVQRGPEGLIAYLVKPDGSVATQTVHVAERQEGKAVVDQGLQAGERVIVDGQSRVHAGVKVVEAKEAAPMPPVARAGDKR